MVRIRQPGTPTTSEDWEEIQQDAIPLRDATEALKEIAAASNTQKSSKGGRSLSKAGKMMLDATMGATWDAALEFQSMVKDIPDKVRDGITVAQAVRMTARGYVHRFPALLTFVADGSGAPSNLWR